MTNGEMGLLFALVKQVGESESGAVPTSIGKQLSQIHTTNL